MAERQAFGCRIDPRLIARVKEGAKLRRMLINRFVEQALWRGLAELERPSRIVGIEFDPDMWHMLECVAESQGITALDVIRRAVADFLKNHIKEARLDVSIGDQ